MRQAKAQEVSLGRQAKYVNTLTTVAHHMWVPFRRAKRKDIEDLMTRLADHEFTKEELGRDREQAPLLRGDHGRLQDHGQEVHEVRKIRRHGQGHPLPRGGEMAQEDHQGEREAGAPLLHRRGGPRSDQGGRHDEGQGPHLRRARARTCGEGGGKDTRVRQKARDDPPRSSSKPAAVATSNHPTTPPTSRG